MFTVAGHCTVLDGVSPVLARADAVTTLNVEPGGKIPSSARSKPPGRSTMARTPPVDGWITTMSTGSVVLACDTACEAASWTDSTMRRPHRQSLGGGETHSYPVLALARADDADRQ